MSKKIFQSLRKIYKKYVWSYIFLPTNANGLAPLPPIRKRKKFEFYGITRKQF
ncbi:hypothetical protein PACTADRAFT_77928 [Pachysolen tannophilus NRRL Y-2460]|uniref:Uncharacterized protein n=1 Tax=Pachysolen tannophilus NRRL Y-2460 TaxID=669874 RepID=A0A1E4TMR2_PACTA|nr:hypothetical protein PACTADRAFT_77928 [Pachysolen tannophilus NRRL Y-2460]